MFNDPATTEIYTLSLHNALPICKRIPKEVLDSLHMVRDERICRLTVLVQVGRESSYDKVVAVMDAIQYNQIARFSIVEQTPEHLKAIEEAKKKAASGQGGKA